MFLYYKIKVVKAYYFKIQTTTFFVEIVEDYLCLINVDSKTMKSKVCNTPTFGIFNMGDFDISESTNFAHNKRASKKPAKQT